MRVFIVFTFMVFNVFIIGCQSKSINDNHRESVNVKERQISFSWQFEQGYYYIVGKYFKMANG